MRRASAELSLLAFQAALVEQAIRNGTIGKREMPIVTQDAKIRTIRKHELRRKMRQGMITVTSHTIVDLEKMLESAQLEKLRLQAENDVMIQYCKDTAEYPGIPGEFKRIYDAGIARDEQIKRIEQIESNVSVILDFLKNGVV